MKLNAVIALLGIAVAGTLLAAAASAPGAGGVPAAGAANYLKYDLPATAVRHDISELFPDDNDMHWAYVDAQENVLATETFSGATKNMIERRLYKDGKQHGLQKTYFSDGKKKNAKPYRDGVLDGVCRAWDDQGQLLEASLIQNGNGTEKLYQASGLIDHQYEYKDNKLTTAFALHPNGQLQFRTSYANGHFAPGDMFNFTPGGTLAAYMAIDNDGQYHGPLFQWTDDGKVARQLYFVHGKKATADEYNAARAKDPTLPEPLTLETYTAKVPEDLKTFAARCKEEKPVTIPLQDIADP